MDTLFAPWELKCKAPDGPLFVLYFKNARVGSFPMSELPEAHRLMSLSLMQRDISGGEHYAVVGVNEKEYKRRLKEV